MNEKLNFLQYLATQEQNLITSLVNLRQDFDIFSKLDEIYRAPLTAVDVPNKEAVIAQLYLFVHSEFYFSASCMLRAHISECLASVRKAIDGALSAYRLILEPCLMESYKTRDWTFQTIKSHIQKARKADSSKYPLAEHLIELHEHCSQLASHADYTGIEPRIEIQKFEQPFKEQQLLHYFDHPRDLSVYHALFVDVLVAFYRMLYIFRPFLAQKFTISPKEWEQNLDKIGELLIREQDRCREVLQKKGTA